MQKEEFFQDTHNNYKRCVTTISSHTLYIEYFFEEGSLTTTMEVLLQEH